MTTTFNPFATNPIVPSTFSYTFLTLSTANTDLQWPSAFIDGAYYVAAFIEVVSNDSAYNIKMPDARLASTGAGTIISNQGANDFNVVDNAGNVIIAGVEATNSILIYLTDSTTQSGEWSTLIIGAKTAEANAAALAGSGLWANVGGKLNTKAPVTDISTSGTISILNTSGLVRWTGGNGTLTLNTIYYNVNGEYLAIHNSSPSNGILTINVSSSGTIDDLTEVQLTYNQSAFFISDGGTKFYTVGLGRLSAGAGVALSPEGIKVVNGTTASPSYSFISSPNTGLSISGANDLNVSISGTKEAVFNNTGLNVKGGIYWNDVNLLYFAGIYP